MGLLRSNPAHILLAILFLSAPLVALAPGADAQSISITSRNDHGYGWTFPEGDDFPGGAVEDAADDVVVEVEDGGAAPIGAAPLAEAIDLVGARIDEPDAEVLRLVLQVTAIDPQRVAIEHWFTGGSLESQFTISGDTYQVITYLMTSCQEGAQVCDPYSDPVAVASSRMYRVVVDDMIPVGYLPTRVVEEQARIEILIPRWALDGPPGAAAPLKEDRVTDLHVTTSAGWICIIVCTKVSDRLPDAGTVTDLHTLTRDSHGARLRIADGRGPGVDAEGHPSLQPLRPRSLLMDVPDQTAQIPVRIENLVGQKALIVAAVEVRSDHDVEVRVPKSMEVPAGDVRKLLLDVSGATAFTLEDPLVLRLSLESIGSRPATDVATLVVRTVPTLSPEDPRLYLHTYAIEGGRFPIPGSDRFDYVSGVLNTIADDPHDTQRSVYLNEFCFCINNVYGWGSLGGIPDVLHLDPETPGTLRFEVDAPVPGTLHLEPALSLGDTLVASADHAVELEQGVNTVEVPLYVPEEAAVLEPSGDTFYFGFRSVFRPGGVVLSEFVGLAEPVNPTLKTGGASWIGLPVVDAAHRFANATHITVDLERGVDRVQYLNAGRTTLWNITVANQADEADTVTVTATVPDGWKAKTVPGASYRLGPGESVTVGVRASAPTDAAEGATAEVRVAVASQLADGAATGTMLSAVVTNAMAIPEPAYVADNETAARLADRTTTEESPGVPLVVGILLVLVPALLRRRTDR